MIILYFKYNNNDRLLELFLFIYSKKNSIYCLYNLYNLYVIIYNYYNY